MAGRLRPKDEPELCTFRSWLEELHWHEVRILPVTPRFFCHPVLRMSLLALHIL